LEKLLYALTIRSGVYISIIFDVIKTFLGLILVILVYTNVKLQFVDELGNEESLKD